MSGLPSCRVQHPSCGACGLETRFDGDSFICEYCGLNYGSGDDYQQAEFIDEEAEACGKPCDNFWHGDGKITEGWSYACEPCPLPKDHASDHWTDCRPLEIHAQPR